MAFLDYAGVVKFTSLLKTKIETLLETKQDAIEYGTVQGGTGNHTWYYRKWASGMEEAWGVCTVSSITGSVWASPIYYYNLTVTWPDMFTSAPTQAYITGRNYQWTVVGHGAPTKTGMEMRLTKPVSTAQNITLDIYLVHN